MDLPGHPTPTENCERKKQDEEELEFLEGNPERICKM